MSYDPATYVEGVPVKISEKYRPPRKVSPSPLGNYQVNTDILTTEYSLANEHDTIKWLQNLKNYKENKRKIREEKIKQYLEEKERLKEEERKLKEEQERILKEEEEERKAKEKEEQERKIKEEQERKIQEETELQIKKDEEPIKDEDTEEVQENKNIDTSGNKELSKDTTIEIKDEVKSSNEENLPQVTKIPLPVDEKEGNNVIPYNYLNSNAKITPTASSEVSTINNYSTNATQQYPLQIEPSQVPMLVPTQCFPQGSHHKSPTKGNCKINFADFEGDASDPFDSVALKSINDMEELAKVLQTSNLKQQKSDTNNSNLSYTQPGPYVNGGYFYNPYPYMNYQQQLNLSVNNSSQYNQSSSYQSKILSVPFAAAKPNHTVQNENFSQWGHASQNSASRTTDIPQFKAYNYGLPHNVATSNSSNIKVPIDHATSTFQYGPGHSQMVNANLTVSNNSQTQNMVLDSVEKRKDLEDFYTRYYLNKKSSGVRSGDSTPTSHLQSSKSLPSSNSVPDLTVIEDNEVSNIVSNNHFDKNSYKPSSCSTPPRPSSTVGYEVLNKSNFVRGNAKSPVSCGLKPRLLDPFAELNEEAQSLVQSISEMGFPRPRVARAVQKLGTDHKKLLEVLLTLQSYQENGDDEYLSERAFYFYMGQVEKVNEFLTASKTLLNLGFEEEKVMEGLFKHENDKDKCLEELIS